MNEVTGLRGSITLGKLEYEELKKLAFAILDEVPYGNFFFLGIGRTPTPLIAFLQCYLGKDCVGQLPLSSFRHNFPGENLKLLSEPLTNESLNIFSKHLNKHLPDKLYTENIDLVVLDFVDSGASLAAITHHIRKHIANRGGLANVISVALCKVKPPQCFLEVMTELGISHYDFIIPGDSNNNTSLASKFGAGKYYNVISPYDRPFKLSQGHHSDDLVKNDNMYVDFLSQLSQKMMKDPDISDPMQEDVATLIYEDQKKVTKCCATKIEARRLWSKFNSFPSHVQTTLEGNRVSYDYIKGVTLEEVICSKDSRSPQSLHQLATLLGCCHWKDVVMVTDYHKICLAKNLYADLEIFDNCYGYLTQIHGDLHMRNILLSERQELVVIDRLRQCGDMMYDFSVVLSLLCFTELCQDDFFVNLLPIFFKTYEGYVDDKDNFYRAFRNNFINYGLFAHTIRNNSQPPFVEWGQAKRISESLMKYHDFRVYIDKEFGVSW